MEHLDDEECWSLLADASVGRLGVIVDGRPEILPVNHGVDGRSVVFRTDYGGKLRGLARQSWVAFEADGVDEDREAGWSVLVKGRADEVVDRSEIERLASLDVHFWGVGEKSHWIRIDPVEVTGRRIPHGPGFQPNRTDGAAPRYS